ncbi:pilus assembly protein [Acinetobacter sp. ANC 4558]|uniref:fimbrial biogenesis chaperone n=1 Tax=Acinetobacter sp. ANC 4558 TaxID=1977876 RepID=UPI000A359102|nr:fimbria/pilus periplasmic chaperone [Acinetobacter sp. ANC 4558]OTG82483.1 pilus assembly protein [Acinetobacter sp. ANC 4558]
MKFNQLLKAVICTILIPIYTAHAEIIIHGTRAIYPSDAREITIQVSNNGTKPSLVQAWIDDGDAKVTPDQSKAPFLISPPISRVEAQKGQALRIAALPKTINLSKTQETLFWLNVLDIPPKPTTKNETDIPDNFLQLAIRSRIKFFYRPAGLKEDISLAPTKLQWFRKGSSLEVKNPTPYHITITGINSTVGDKNVELLADGVMLKPFSTEKLNISNAVQGKLSFTTINDYGGRVETELKLN